MKFVHDELIKQGYNLVFEDHFEGDSLNKDNWQIITMCQNGKNGREAWRKPENLSIKDSKLTITARIEEDGRYTSGMINTNKKFMYKYGYLEIKAHLPKGGPGIWPGFWTQSVYKGATVNTEIDIFEMFGDDSYIACALHAWWNDKVYNKQHHIDYMHGDYEDARKRIEGKKMSDEEHTIGFFWTEECIDFTVDGESYYHTSIDNPLMAPFHVPLYIIISMAFGLPFLNQPKEDRTEPIEYVIDYIRLYQDDSGKLYDFNEDGSIKER